MATKCVDQILSVKMGRSIGVCPVCLLQVSLLTDFVFVIVCCMQGWQIYRKHDITSFYITFLRICNKTFHSVHCH